MTQAKQGDTVSVHYTGKLDDGTVFDSSLQRDPLQFTLGEQQVIPGFEEAVFDMAPGTSKTVRVPAEQAYGPYYNELVQEVDRSILPDELEPEIGQQLQAQLSSGQVVTLRVKEISDTTVTLDPNHPLAGQDLTFDIELINID